MTEEFRTLIKEHIENGDSLFYNGKGRTEAYMLYVRHIKEAPFLRFGFKVSKTIHLYKPVYLVDFDKETIEKSGKTVDLILE